MVHLFFVIKYVCRIGVYTFTAETLGIEIKGPVFGLRQFLAAERDIKMMKNVFSDVISSSCS